MRDMPNIGDMNKGEKNMRIEETKQRGKYDNLPVGTEIYYTGDMANADGYGTITKVREATRFAPISYDITMEGGREIKGLYFQMFQPSPGRRFWLKAEHEAEREARIAQMRARGNIYDEHNGLKGMGPYGPAYLR